MEKKTRLKVKKKLAKQFRDVGMKDLHKHRCLIYKCLVTNFEGPLKVHYMGKIHRTLEKLELYTFYFLEFVLYPVIH